TARSGWCSRAQASTGPTHGRPAAPRRPPPRPPRRAPRRRVLTVPPRPRTAAPPPRPPAPPPRPQPRVAAPRPAERPPYDRGVSTPTPARADVAVIGGSGLYRFLTDAHEVAVDTPFG